MIYHIYIQNAYAVTNMPRVLSMHRLKALFPQLLLSYYLLLLLLLLLESGIVEPPQAYIPSPLSPYIYI